MRKKIGPTKYPRENILYPEILTRKYLRPKKYPQKKCRTHKITSRKNFGTTKYSRQNILDPKNSNEKRVWSHKSAMARWHETYETHDGMRPKELSTLYKHKSIIKELCCVYMKTFNTIKNHTNVMKVGYTSEFVWYLLT